MQPFAQSYPNSAFLASDKDQGDIILRALKYIAPTQNKEPRMEKLRNKKDHRVKNKQIHPMMA